MEEAHNSLAHPRFPERLRTLSRTYARAPPPETMRKTPLCACASCHRWPDTSRFAPANRCTAGRTWWFGPLGWGGGGYLDRRHKGGGLMAGALGRAGRTRRRGERGGERAERGASMGADHDIGSKQQRQHANALDPHGLASTLFPFPYRELRFMPLEVGL
jgi:hypothetical protein